MSSDTAENPLSPAEVLAQRAIEAGAEGRWQQAVDGWTRAIESIEPERVDSDFHHWLRTGLADALCETGQFERSLQVVKPAHGWCVSIGQPLASLCMAKALWALGWKEQTRVPLSEAVRLGGLDVLLHFGPEQRPALQALLNEQNDQDAAIDSLSGSNQ